MAARKRKVAIARARSEAARKGWETRRRNLLLAEQRRRARSDSARRGWESRRKQMVGGVYMGTYPAWSTPRLVREMWKEQQRRELTGKGSKRLSVMHRVVYQRLEARLGRDPNERDWIALMTDYTAGDFEEARESFFHYH